MGEAAEDLIVGRDQLAGIDSRPVLQVGIGQRPCPEGPEAAGSRLSDGRRGVLVVLGHLLGAEHGSGAEAALLIVWQVTEHPLSE